MEVVSDRVSALDAGEPRGHIRRQHAKGTERAVDVEPQSLLAGQVRQRGQVVDGADVDGACSAHDQEGDVPRLAVCPDARAQRCKIHSVARIGRNGAQRGGSEPCQLERLFHATVRSRAAP